MQATKFELAVKIETLSIDVIKSLLCDVLNNIEEFPLSEKRADDGDYIKWELKKTDVEF